VTNPWLICFVIPGPIPRKSMLGGNNFSVSRVQSGRCRQLIVKSSGSAWLKVCRPKKRPGAQDLQPLQLKLDSTARGNTFGNRRPKAGQSWDLQQSGRNGILNSFTSCSVDRFLPHYPTEHGSYAGRSCCYLDFRSHRAIERPLTSRGLPPGTTNCNQTGSLSNTLFSEPGFKRRAGVDTQYVSTDC
jgi:hypothetical protein